MNKNQFIGLLGLCSISASSMAAGQLNIYNWSGYTPPELVKKFEIEFDVTVTVDSYDSDETLLAKLQQGGAGYDIAVTGNVMLPIIIEQGLAENIDASSMPEYANVIDKLAKPAWDSTGSYSVPWQWGTTSFAVDTAVVDLPTSFSALFEPQGKAQGKVNMFDSAANVIAQASIYLGISQCTEEVAELQKVADLLKRQKPHVRSYSSKAGAIREQLVAGEIVMSPLWSGSTMKARELRSDISYVYPKEGVLAWVDNVFVPKGAKNPENAKAFIAFIARPENAAIISNSLKYQNGIKGANDLMDADLKAAPELNPPADVKMVFSQTCSEKTIKMHDRIWLNLLK